MVIPWRVYCHRERGLIGRCGDPVVRPQTFHEIASSFTSFAPRKDSGGRCHREPEGRGDPVTLLR